MDSPTRTLPPLPPAALAAHPLLSHRVVPQEWMDWPDWFEAIGVGIPAGHRLIGFDSFPLVLQAALACRAAPGMGSRN